MPRFGELCDAHHPRPAPFGAHDPTIRPHHFSHVFSHDSEHRRTADFGADHEHDHPVKGEGLLRKDTKCAAGRRTLALPVTAIAVLRGRFMSGARLDQP